MESVQEISGTPAERVAAVSKIISKHSPLLLAASLSEASADDAELRREFADPPLRWQSRPLWFWNGKLDADKTKGMVAACKAAGYYGMGILPCNGMGVDFMSPEFLKHYKVAVDAAGKLGMKMCLYDEFWFPSGSAGGLLAKKHPEALGKRLDMLAADVSGPREFTQAVPKGTLMGAVAMAAATKQRLDITASIKNGTLCACQAGIGPFCSSRIRRKRSLNKDGMWGRAGGASVVWPCLETVGGDFRCLTQTTSFFPWFLGIFHRF